MLTLQPDNGVIGREERTVLGGTPYDEQCIIKNNKPEIIQDDALIDVTGGGNGYLTGDKCPYCNNGTLVYDSVLEYETVVLIKSRCPVCGENAFYVIYK